MIRFLLFAGQSWTDRNQAVMLAATFGCLVICSILEEVLP